MLSYIFNFVLNFSLQRIVQSAYMDLITNENILTTTYFQMMICIELCEY